MNWRVLIVLALWLLPIRVIATPATPEDPCRQAIAAAERAHAIPPNLLAAIAHVESGRRDPVTGTVHPWPWTINMDGGGSFYATKAEAVAAARGMRPRAVRSIDVGCMQISLTQHPNAFPDLETAFDPTANVEYGARFLVELHQKTNSWEKAVEMYHSATPEIGQPYQQRVYAAWHGGGIDAGVAPATGQWFPLAAAWAATISHPSMPVFTQSAPPRILRLAQASPTLTANAAPPRGRTLSFYRATPIPVASRPPSRPH